MFGTKDNAIIHCGYFFSVSVREKKFFGFGDKNLFVQFRFCFDAFSVVIFWQLNKYYNCFLVES